MLKFMFGKIGTQTDAFMVINGRVFHFATFNGGNYNFENFEIDIGNLFTAKPWRRGVTIKNKAGFSDVSIELTEHEKAALLNEAIHLIENERGTTWHSS